MGIVPLLRNVLFPPPVPSSSSSSSSSSKVAKPVRVCSILPSSCLFRFQKPRVEIFGPAGIRNFVRQIMKMTLTRTSDTYTVHELLTKKDVLTPCLLSSEAVDDVRDQDFMHLNEVAGKDILCTHDSFWKGVTKSKGISGEIIVDAGPISHRDPCIGYIFRETSGPLRKLVILGDTYDPSAIIPLCISPPPSLLIHEATDAHIPKSVDYNHRRTPEAVLEKVLANGHSIPTMAGAFAKTIEAKRLVLNHISGRFPAPRHPGDHRTAVIREIERQATKAWGSGTSAIAAWDFMNIIIPMHTTDTVSTELLSSMLTPLPVSSGDGTQELHHGEAVKGKKRRL